MYRIKVLVILYLFFLFKYNLVSSKEYELKNLVVVLLLVIVSISHSYGKLQVLGEESPPGEYIDENGQPAGVTIELVRELLKRTKVEADIKIFPWKRAYYLGLNGKEVALMETTRTKEREDLFKWVGPILVVKRVVYALENYVHKINKADDLKNNDVVCVLRGSSNESYLRNELKIGKVHAVAKPIQCIRLLFANRVKLFYTSEIGLTGLLKDQKISPSKFKPVLTLKKEYLYLAFSKDTEDKEITRWQRHFKDIKKDGTLARIYKGTYSKESIKEVCLPGDPLAKN